MLKMNPKTFLQNTTFSVQPPYIAGHSLLYNFNMMKHEEMVKLS